MQVDVRGGHDLADERSRLLAASREELTVAFGHSARSESGRVFLVTEAVAVEESMIIRHNHVLEWRAELTRDVAWKCRENGVGALFLHAHQGPGAVELSPVDCATACRLIPHLATFAPDQLHGYGAVSDTDVSGLFQFGEDVLPWARLHLLAAPTLKIVTSPLRRELVVDRSRYDRHVIGFGMGLQRRLAELTVAVVGLGGGGSIVSEQLAMMGVGHLILVDADVLKVENRPRVVGSSDEQIGELKVSIAAQLARRAQPGIEVRTFPTQFPAHEVLPRLREADVIVAAVDSAVARSEINEFARRYLVPLISIGATIRRGDRPVGSIHGHVARVMPFDRCLECMGIVSEELRRGDAPTGYGEGAYGPANPQVASVNGTLASMACTEVLRLIGGLPGAEVSQHLALELVEPTIHKLSYVGSRCDVCGSEGKGDATT